MDDTGARDKNLTCVSKGSFHAYKPGSCIHQTQRTLFFFHAVSQETSERKMPRPPMPLVFFIALQYGSESCRVSGKQIFQNYKI